MRWWLSNGFTIAEHNGKKGSCDRCEKLLRREMSVGVREIARLDLHQNHLHARR